MIRALARDQARATGALPLIRAVPSILTSLPRAAPVHRARRQVHSRRVTKRRAPDPPPLRRPTPPLRFDFYCYTQLNATLEKVFFPTNNPTIQALAFWGVYAAAFVVR